MSRLVRYVVNSTTVRLTEVKLSRDPYEYTAEMPSKGVRNSVIDSLDNMYQVPEKSLAIIRDIVNSLHNASLMSVDSSCY